MDLTSTSGVSDGLLLVAIVGYVAAMAAHGLELAITATRSANASTPGLPKFALAGVGGPPSVTAIASSAAGPGRGERRAGIAAVALTVLAALAHTGCVVTRAVAAGRVPWGNMYEFILTTALVGAVAWLVVLARRPVRPMGLFVTLALVVVLGGAGRVHTRVAPLSPALESPWLRVHVAAAALATGLFLLGFITAGLYVLRLRHDAGDGVDRGSTIRRLPAPRDLDRLSYRFHIVAFPIWTFAILAGAVWAEAAWGRYWGWDPKETWAFISWVLYAAYLHSRTTGGWRGERTAMIALAAWITMMFNLFTVNIMFSGLHSYAGL